MKRNFYIGWIFFGGSVRAEWTLCHSEGLVPCVSTTVPMNVLETLFRNGLVSDLFDGANRWIAESDWIMTRIFSPSERSDSDMISLGGVTSPAELYMDDKLYGNLISAFHETRFEIPSSDRSLNVTVLLKSSVKEAASKPGIEIPICPPDSWRGFCGIQYLRNPQYLFGWDWGPGTGSSGVDRVDLWKSNQRNDFFEQLVISTRMDESGARWTIQLTCIDASLHVLNIDLESESGTVILSDFSCSEFPCEISVKSVDSWWPRGYGSQPLYKLNLCTSGSVCIVRMIGFREFEIGSTNSVSGWELVWNRKKPIIIKGVNLVPTSAFRDSSIDEITELFASLDALNVNLIRQWGGGYYTRSEFFDFADRKGILVWEDLKFAGATYPVDDEQFMSELRPEISLFMARAHWRPSLVLVSMDNEVKQMLDQNWFNVSQARLDQYYDRYDVLQNHLASLVEPFRISGMVVIPTSPWEGFDDHFYDYESDCLDPASFPKSLLVSEFGYQSWCGSRCLGLSEQELSLPWTQSEFLSVRQHRAKGNEEIWNRISRQFPHLRNISVREFVWWSQVSHAVCLKSAAETFRRQDMNVGAVVWQLNDVWPTASWSLVGYDGIRKPAFFSIRNAMHHGFISLFVENGHLIVGSRTEHPPVHFEHLKVRIIDLVTGDVKTIEIPPIRIHSTDFTVIARISDICKYNCIAAVSRTNYIPLGPLDRGNISPKSFGTISIQRKSSRSFRVSVSTAPSLYIYLECNGANFDRNFFLLIPDLWDWIDLESDEDCTDPQVYHFWSFPDQPSTYIEFV